MTLGNGLTLNGGAFTAGNSVIKLTGGDWLVTAGVFTANTSTVSFDSAATQGLTTGGSNFYNIMRTNSGNVNLNDNLTSTGSPYAGGTDPRGPTSSPYALRVSRGGSWINKANLAPCAQRTIHSPNLALNSFGLRCVRAP